MKKVYVVTNSNASIFVLARSQKKAHKFLAEQGLQKDLAIIYCWCLNAGSVNMELQNSPNFNWEMTGLAWLIPHKLSRFLRGYELSESEKENLNFLSDSRVA